MAIDPGTFSAELQAVEDALDQARDALARCRTQLGGGDEPDAPAEPEPAPEPADDTVEGPAELPEPEPEA